MGPVNNASYVSQISASIIATTNKVVDAITTIFWKVVAAVNVAYVTVVDWSKRLITPEAPQNPVNPQAPVGPMQPIDPLNPVAPQNQQPVQNPVAPQNPLNPQNPVAPQNPPAPQNPQNPVAPLTTPVTWYDTAAKGLKATAPYFGTVALLSMGLRYSMSDALYSAIPLTLAAVCASYTNQFAHNKAVNDQKADKIARIDHQIQLREENIEAIKAACVQTIVASPNDVAVIANANRQRDVIINQRNFEIAQLNAVKNADLVTKSYAQKASEYLPKRICSVFAAVNPYLSPVASEVAKTFSVVKMVPDIYYTAKNYIYGKEIDPRVNRLPDAPIGYLESARRLVTHVATPVLFTAASIYAGLNCVPYVNHFGISATYALASSIALLAGKKVYNAVT